jgi:Flp pilus assembly protein TadB
VSALAPALLPAVLAGLAALAAGRPRARLPVPDAEPVPGRDRPAWLLPAAAAASAGGATWLLVGGSLGIAAGAVVAVVAGRAVARMEPPAARRHREALEAGLPQAVDLLAACLAAGRAPGPAVAEVADALDGPLADLLAGVAVRLRLGADPVTVWRELAGHPQLGRLGRCVLRAVDSGASVADAMTRLAEDLRRDARARVEGRARAVGVKAALPLGLCMLPAFVLVGVVPLVVGSLSALLDR